uniref:Uncharacterized protein n=1 Tax=Fundulus heteroclitus TaxID=8078 RepID=A0A3Q2SQ24_FUNHE
TYFKNILLILSSVFAVHMMRAAQLLLTALRCGPPQLSTEAVWGSTVVGYLNKLGQSNLVKTQTCMPEIRKSKPISDHVWSVRTRPQIFTIILIFPSDHLTNLLRTLE